MIRVYLCDYAELTDIPSALNPNQRGAASYAAYYALESLYTLTYFERMPEIRRTPEGKPYFAENPYGAKFSIAHTERYAVAILTDIGECGVDIECEKSARRAERVEKRFLSGLCLALPPFLEQPQVLVARQKNAFGTSDGCELTVGHVQDDIEKILYPRKERELCELEVNENLGALSRWTLLEAVLKADGRGFGAYKSVEEIIDYCAARHYCLSDGGEIYYLSVVIKAEQ